MTNEWAVIDPYGLYHCDLDVAVMQIGHKFISSAVVDAAIVTLSDLGFCSYDPNTRFMWVKQQANHQLLEGQWRALKEKDWKVQSAIKWYARLPDNPFLGPFFDLYGAYLRIPADERRQYSSRRPAEGASKPHASGASKPQDQDQRSDLFGERGGVGEGEPHIELARGRRAGKTRPSLSGQPLARDFTGMQSEFDTWWRLYPKKVGKGDAWSAYLKLAPPFEQLMATTQAYIDSEEWKEREDGSAAIPHPSTFLNGRRWEDTPTPKRLSRDHRRALGVAASPAPARKAAAAVTVWDEVVATLKRENVTPDRLGLFSGSRMGDVITRGRPRPLMVIELRGDEKVATETGDAIETIYGDAIRRVLRSLGHNVDVHYGPIGEQKP